MVCLSLEIEHMNPLFKSRVKKIFVAAICLGIFATLFFGWTAWNHNPQNEFHTNGVVTSNFYVLVLTTFGLITSATLLVCLPIAYFFSQKSNTP